MKKFFLILALMIGAATAASAQQAPVIRYYNTDSVTVNYVLAQELNAESQKRMTEYQALEKKLTDELQKMANKIETKVRNKQYKSEVGYNADMNGFNKRQEDVQKQLANEQQKLANFANEQQSKLLNTVNAFVAKYAREHSIDIILTESSILPGTYFDPSLNITADIISGLNLDYMRSTTSSLTAPAETPAEAPAATE